MGESRSAFKILTCKPLGRPRRRWEHNIRMDLKEKSVSTINLINSSHDMDYWRTLVNVILNLRVP